MARRGITKEEAKAAWELERGMAPIAAKIPAWHDMNPAKQAHAVRFAVSLAKVSAAADALEAASAEPINPWPKAPEVARCELCDSPLDSTRCTNGRCRECHRKHCTPGGNDSPGHGRGNAKPVSAESFEAKVERATDAACYEGARVACVHDPEAFVRLHKADQRDWEYRKQIQRAALRAAGMEG